MAAEAATGRTPDRLKVPPMPACFGRQLGLWSALHRHRQAGWGLTRFTWGDFAAFCAVTGEQLSLDDLAIIDIIEDEFFASYYAAEEHRKKADERRRPQQPKLVRPVRR